MMRPAESREQFHRQCVIALVVGGVVVVSSTIWAWLPLSALPLVAEIQETTAPVTVAAMPAEIVVGETWAVGLWQPLVDQPAAAPAPPPPPPPLTVKLFSVFKRGSIYIAAVDPGDGTPLQYAKVGDRVQGVQVVDIDARGMTVLNAEQRQRVELAR